MRQLCDELVNVLVARNQQRLVPLRLVTGGNRAQDVVAFPSLNLDDGDVHRLQEALDYGKLHA